MGAAKMRWKRRQPVSTLRARLEDRVSERYDSRDYPVLDEKPGRRNLILVWFGQMHRGLKLKITIAILVVFLAGLINARSPAQDCLVLEGLHDLVNWNIDLRGLFDRAIPAFKTAWENGTMPRFNAGVSAPGTLQTPVTGTLQSAYGLRHHPSDNLEQMHYGIDLTAPAGSPVRAVLDGQVVEIAGTGETMAVLLEHHDGWQTFYQGLVGVEIFTGAPVIMGQKLGCLGEATLWEEPHLHFELRYRGRPVEPPQDWVALFASD